ncbi:unnamed protein product [Rotaria magnacalcarata]|uniref:Uncharacterized protein n=1 Tax=Rotaria magnacalcarata TaxID=392030 RepID=A0A816U643_9BILA|nr:unnamed protein product [Rotaria magnacalcarata]
MVIKWFTIILMSSVLWTLCLCQNECTSSINNGTQIVFECLSDVIINELPLYGYTAPELATITSIVVNGVNDTTLGPFTSIPPNICLLFNLKSIDFSHNRITQVDPVGILNKCLPNLTSLDVSYNNISEFPSALIYNMPTLQYLYFQHNQLINVPGNAFYNISNLEIIDFSYNFLTNFELWTLAVRQSADFSNNHISIITNSIFNNISQYTLLESKIYLANNSATINLTDAIYEMYSSCSEVYYWLNASTPMELLTKPLLSSALSYIDFGTTKINCSCDQSYIVTMINSVFATTDPAIASKIPIYSAQCADGRRLVDSACHLNIDLPNSSIDFSQVYPRQCKIYQYEGGNLTSMSNITVPTINASTYPHYETRSMTPGACFFTFSNLSTVRIICTNDTSNSSTIPNELLSSNYFSNITRIDFGRSISSLPSYLCSLPSGNIDLSFQSFTTLTDETFPCLDSFRSVILNNNQLTNVTMKSGNFTNLVSLDLSSNGLREIPYSILTPTPSSLRFLDLRNNSINSIDLFLYTLKNITVDLRDNPINSSTIINPKNVTLSQQNNTNSPANITFPIAISNSTYILNDQAALTAGTCNSYAVLVYRNALRSTYNNILLDCTCASINLKQIFLRSQSNILDDFNCSNGSLVESFNNLTILSCESTALNFATGLCYTESLQILPDNITAGSLNTSIQLTNTPITILTINSSSILTKNQQYTYSPDFKGSSSNFYSLKMTNTSNPLSNLYTETVTSIDPSYSEVVLVRSTSSNNQVNISSPMNLTTILIDTTTALSATSFVSNASLITKAEETLTDSNVIISTNWTTSTTTTTTSTSTTSTTTSTTSTSTTTSTTSVTTSTTSTSTSTTSVTTSTTSTSSTTTSVTTSTTSTSTSTSSTTTTTTITTSTTTILLLNRDDPNENRTALIIGLVLGLVGLFTLAGGITAAMVIKIRAANNAVIKSKPVFRTAAINQAPHNALLQSHLQTRNVRSVRLAPINTKTSQLPSSSIGSGGLDTSTTNTSATIFNRSDLHRPSRGIPLRMDSVRPPRSVAPSYAPNPLTSNDPSNLSSMNNSSDIFIPIIQYSYICFIQRSLLTYDPSTNCSTYATNGSNLILTCPKGTSLQQLPSLPSDPQWYTQFTSFLAQGENDTRGPFTTIPLDICLFSNLTILNLAYNQIGNILDISYFLNCSTLWKVIDLSRNYLTTFPSTLFTYNRFKTVYLNDNQLYSFDLSILVLVQNTVDLRNNQITSITNPTNYSITLGLQTGEVHVLLDGNHMFPFNDAIYEIYGSCAEVQLTLNDSLSGPTSLTRGLINIDFGTTQVNCSCDQYYILRMLQRVFGSPIVGPISSLQCANQQTTFLNYTCPLDHSTMNFTKITPRLCTLVRCPTTITLKTDMITTSTRTPTDTSTSTETPQISSTTTEPPTKAQKTTTTKISTTTYTHTTTTDTSTNFMQYLKLQ